MLVISSVRNGFLVFGPQQLIDNSTQGPFAVFAADLDGDGDLDVVSVSQPDRLVFWFENYGNESFGPLRLINDQCNSCQAVFAADLDGDGQIDVLAVAVGSNDIWWYRNINNGTSWGPPQQLTTDGTASPRWVVAADLDNDDDMDVISASSQDGKIAWYENNGVGSFGAQDILGVLDGAWRVFACDLDLDGDVDILASSTFSDKGIWWFENIQNASSWSGKKFIANVNIPQSIFAADLNGDGFPDVISIAVNLNKIIWFENYQNGSFGPEQTVGSSVNFPSSIFAADFNRDGFVDVLVAIQGDNRISWFENYANNGSWSPEKIITNSTNTVKMVYAADFNGDRFLDVISASSGDDKVAWYENIGKRLFQVAVDLRENMPCLSSRFMIQ